MARGQLSNSSSIQPSYPLHDELQHSSHSKKKRGHPLFTTDNTVWASDEAILAAENGGTAPNQKNTGTSESMATIELAKKSSVKVDNNKHDGILTTRTEASRKTRLR